MVVTNAADRFARGSSRALKIAVGNTVSNRKVRNQETSWADFVERFRDPVRTKETFAEYLKLSPTQQNEIKDNGYFVAAHFLKGIRKKRGMGEKHMLTLDGDFFGVGWQDELDLAYSEFSFVAHTTHKHGPDKPRVRVLFELTRPVEEDEHQAVARKIAELMGMDYFDDSTYQFSRVMYWPSCSADAEYVCVVNKGRPVNPDEVLGWYTDWKDITEWPTSSRQDKALRRVALKAEDPTQKKGVVGAFCRAFDVPAAIDEFLPNVYLSADDQYVRYSYSGGTTENGAVVYDDGKFLYSHHGTDPCGGRLVNAFDLVRIHLFGEADEKTGEDTPVTKLPSFKKMADWCSEIDRVQAERIVDILPEFDVVADGEIEALDDDAPWVKKLIVDKGEGIAANLRNLSLILENDPNLVGCVRFNEFSGDLVQTRDLPSWPMVDEENGDLWTDHCEVVCKYYVERVYDLQVGRGLLSEAIDLVGHDARFHPIRDYLSGLEWDGRERLDRLFVDYLGAEDSQYIREAARKMMTAAVARVFEPGKKFDHVVILEGKQGQRKSLFIETLARGYFTDGLSTFDRSREAIETMKGKWILELPELAVMGKSQIEATKAFVTRRADRAREAYARRAQDFKRQCIFMGTTNETHRGYLQDDTGNRRFWPVRVEYEDITIGDLQENLDQLWAEATVRYRKREKLYLSRAGEVEAKAIQEDRTFKDEIVGLIEAWLEKPVPIGHYDTPVGESDEFDSEVTARVTRTRVCALEVWTDLMGGRLDNFDKGRARQINLALKRIPGLEPTPGPVGFGRRYGKQRGYTMNDAEPDMDFDLEL